MCVPGQHVLRFHMLIESNQRSGDADDRRKEAEERTQSSMKKMGTKSRTEKVTKMLNERIMRKIFDRFNLTQTSRPPTVLRHTRSQF